MFNSNFFLVASVVVYFVSWSIVLGSTTDEGVLDLEDLDLSEQQDVYFTNEDIDENEDVDDEEEWSQSSGTSGELSDKTSWRKRCRCWVGKKYDKTKILYYFGNIGIQHNMNLDSIKRCQKKCQNQCKRFVRSSSKIKYVQDALCIFLEKEFNSTGKEPPQLGCFSQLSLNESNQDIWKPLYELPSIRCRVRPRHCGSMFGDDYKYHEALGLCVRTLIKNDPSCISGIKPGDNSPPVCCHDGNIYSCQKPMLKGEHY